MVSEELKVINPSGLHLRPAGSLCKEALKYDSKINIIFKDATANAKSVLSVLATCVKCGDVITITCEGKDEKEAMEALRNLINSGFCEVK
jgi:phosphocarrier,  HPr family